MRRHIVAKRNMSIIFIPSNMFIRPPRAPRPFRDNATALEIEIFRKDYWRYYHNKDGETFSDRLESLWMWSTLVGGAIGTAIGFYESRGKPLAPLIGMGVGVAGGLIPPVGAWWLYLYARTKIKK